MFSRNSLSGCAMVSWLLFILLAALVDGQNSSARRRTPAEKRWRQRNHSVGAQSNTRHGKKHGKSHGKKSKSHPQDRLEVGTLFEGFFWMEYNNGSDEINVFTEVENEVVNRVLRVSYNDVVSSSSGILLDQVVDEESAVYDVKVVEYRTGPATRKLQRTSEDYRSSYFHYRVSGRCRIACKTDGRLFNDVNGRRLQESLQQSVQQRLTEVFNIEVLNRLNGRGFDLAYVGATNDDPLEDFTCNSGECVKRVEVEEFNWPEREHTNESRDPGRNQVEPEAEEVLVGDIEGVPRTSTETEQAASEQIIFLP